MWVEGRKCVPGDVSDAPAAQGAPEYTQNTGAQRCRGAKHLPGWQDSFSKET